MSWIPLHVHSQYSILEATGSIKDLVLQAKEYGISSLALTDFCNLYGAVEFYKACTQEQIAPILGVELMVAPGQRTEKKKEYGVPTGYPITLLVKDATGYRNLCKLVSKASLEGFYYYPRIDEELLQVHAEGLICLSGGYGSKVSSFIHHDNVEPLLEEIKGKKALFGDDYYLEIQRHSMSDEAIREHGIDDESWLLQKYRDAIAREEKMITRCKELSKEYAIPLVATNDIHYLSADDWKAHEILMNVQSGEPCEIWERDAYGNPRHRMLNPKRKVAYSHEFYFKSPEQMVDLFQDVPEAIENTKNIADKCAFAIDFKTKYYPVFVPPELETKTYSEEERVAASEGYLRKLCQEGIAKRYTEERLDKVREVIPDKDPMEVIHERLDMELDIIISKGMGDYLLIVHDFIAWAKSQAIPVGPGRGSGAGSIILYLIGVTDIEPLRFHLFFERFINPERLSYPDIDVDICMERRQEVIDYTLNKYGAEKVAQIITFGTMKAKMAIKDVGRVLSVPLAKVNQIAKLVPDELTITLDRALEMDPDFKNMYETDEDAKRIIDLGRKVEGSIRNTGIHAAGIIICGDELTEHIPVCSSKDSEISVTQFSMKPVEAVGMLKIDFLGLKTLTSIQKAVDAIQRGSDEKIDWVDLPLDDKETFDLLNQGKTKGIFQLESSGMQELAKQLHIDSFEEIIAVGALYRPGPMEMIPSFINRKHGKEEIEYDHEALKEILNETYGIMVYQEQVMQLASMLAGYSLGEGDVLRRAMGKKDREEMGRQREKFRLGAIEKGIDEDKAMVIFDKVEKFASYGFNKSHAAAYGYLSYVTAYLKANYPKQWMAALMSCDITDITKVAKHIRECQAMDIAILPPDVNESATMFQATESGIRFALNAIRGVGEGVVEAIVAERHAHGNFASLHDFLQRVEPTRVGKKVVESLILAGAFDFTGWDRSELSHSLEEMFEHVSRQKKEASMGFIDMFAESAEAKSEFTTPPKGVQKTPILEILSTEKELLGFYVTGHPLDQYRDAIEEFETLPLGDFEEIQEPTAAKSAFIVDTVQIRISARSQKKFAILTISNGIERFELPVWPDVFESTSHLLNENQMLVGVLTVENGEEGIRLSCKWLEDLTHLTSEKIDEATATFEMAKKYVKKDHQRRKGKGKMDKENEAKKQQLEIQLDISSLSLKKILRLKHLLQEFPGSTGVQLIFNETSTKLADIEIEPSTGIAFDDALKAKLESLSYCQSARLVDV